MARGLDHIVHAVRDLDAAADLYRRLGFTVGARNRHQWGTHNHIVQMPGFFIELLTFAEPDKLGGDGFSRLFAAYNRDFIARAEGFSLLILESQGGQPIGATVKRIEAVPKRRQSKSPTQYFGVMLTLEKTLPDIMKPGQRVSARLFLHEEEALVAPRPALFDRDGHFIVYRLASGDPKTMTGRIDYAEPFLKEIGVKPAELVA